MTVLYPNHCYTKFCYIGTALYLDTLKNSVNQMRCHRTQQSSFFLTLVLLNPDIFFLENRTDQDQLASDEAI